MCGRYYVDISNDELSFVSNYKEFEYEQNYNVAPQAVAPCIINNELVAANWGYFPDWLKKQSNPRPLFNSRYESLLEKKTFTSAFKNSRCIIPISGWYEWKDEDGIKQPYYFFSNSKPLLYSAGLYWNRSSGDIETSIITREAVGELQTVHNRSPLLLNDRLKDLWFWWSLVIVIKVSTFGRTWMTLLDSTRSIRRSHFTYVANINFVFRKFSPIPNSIMN